MKELNRERNSGRVPPGQARPFTKVTQEAKNQIEVCLPFSRFKQIESGQYAKDEKLRAEALIAYTKQMMLPVEERCAEIRERTSFWESNPSLGRVFISLTGLNELLPNLVSAMKDEVRRQHETKIHPSTLSKLVREEAIRLVREYHVGSPLSGFIKTPAEEYAKDEKLRAEALIEFVRQVRLPVRKKCVEMRGYYTKFESSLEEIFFNTAVLNELLPNLVSAMKDEVRRQHETRANPLISKLVLKEAIRLVEKYDPVESPFYMFTRVTVDEYAKDETLRARALFEFARQAMLPEWERCERMRGGYASPEKSVEEVFARTVELNALLPNLAKAMKDEVIRQPCTNIHPNAVAKLVREEALRLVNEYAKGLYLTVLSFNKLLRSEYER